MIGKGLLDRLFTHRHKTSAVLLAWSASICVLAWWYAADHAESLSEMARIYARACHEKDVIYRRWNAAHGGVYVPTSKGFQPNPYLQAAEREVTTPSGRTLTLVNPAYMTRQVHELAAGIGSVHAHITSLKPLNPNNGPDEWEQKALLAFEKDEKETHVVLHQGSNHTARLMRPLYVEKSCLKCHEQQGYKIGDVRGGISVTVPVDSIWQAEAQQARKVFFALGGIWMLGAVAIVLVGKSMNQRRLEREQAIEALAKKQAFLNAVLDNISDGIVACDADGVLTLFNPATRQFHGLPETPIPAEQWPQHFDLYLPDGTTLMRKEDVPLYRALQGDTVQDSEMVIAPKHGTSRRLLADGRQLIVDGKLVGAVAVMHDITEQRRNEERLAHFSAIVSSSQDAIIGKNLDGIITSWNAGAERLYGYTAEEMVGRSILILLPPNRLDELSSLLAKITRGERVEQYDTIRRRKDGRLVDVCLTLSPITNLDGEIVGISTISRNITDRKRSEQVLHESEERYRSLVENVDMGITLIDRQHRIVMVNEGHARMFKRTAKECVGQECFRLFERREAVCSNCPGIPAMKTGCQAEVETQGVRDDGSTFPVRLRAFPIRDPDGTPNGFIEVVEDITERKRSEEELIGAKQAAEAASRVKSEFLANMSHEIRTPMTAILGFADVLLDEADQNKAPAECVEAIRTIKRNGEHLLQLINDILDLSKIEAGKQQVDIQACSPEQVVLEVLSTMQVRADAKGLKLSVEFGNAIPDRIGTDPLRLRQILVNLVGNAIKFTEGGHVRIVVHRDDSSGKDNRLRFEVVDTGIGMSDEQTAELFQPFSQADTSARRRFGGTGLGLAISKRLAGMLGGDIDVSSVPGKGSCFSVTIATGTPDVAEPTPPSTESQNSVLQTSRSEMLCGRILLAEDGPDNQRLIAFLLRKAGAEVTVAENGQIALNWALEQEQAGSPFDLILMDMQMPVMDGFEATRRLRQAGSRSPIIALTAHAMNEARQQCIDAGCDGYLSKPIDAKTLVRTIIPWVAKNRAVEVKV